VLGLVGFASTAPTIFISPLAGVLADRFPRKRPGDGRAGRRDRAVRPCLALLAWRRWGSMRPRWWRSRWRAGRRSPSRSRCATPLLGELVDDRSAAARPAVALPFQRPQRRAVRGAGDRRHDDRGIRRDLVLPVDAATLTFALWQLSRIPTRPPPPSRHTGEPVLAQLRAGLRYTFAHPLIRVLLTALTVVGLTAGPYANLMPGAVA
jgi:hypothetical protein